MDTIEKINRARKRDKEVRVLQEAQKINQFRRQLPFSDFLRLKGEKVSLVAKPYLTKKQGKPGRALQETTVEPDSPTSIFAAIPVGATDREDALIQVLNQVWLMSQAKDVAITCVALGENQNGS